MVPGKKTVCSVLATSVLGMDSWQMKYWDVSVSEVEEMSSVVVTLTVYRLPLRMVVVVTSELKIFYFNFIVGRE